MGTFRISARIKLVPWININHEINYSNFFFLHLVLTQWSLQTFRSCLEFLLCAASKVRLIASWKRKFLAFTQSIGLGGIHSDSCTFHIKQQAWTWCGISTNVTQLNPQRTDNFLRIFWFDFIWPHDVYYTRQDQRKGFIKTFKLQARRLIYESLD